MNSIHENYDGLAIINNAVGKIIFLKLGKHHITELNIPGVDYI